MLVFSILLLTTSAFAAPNVLLPEHPDYQQQDVLPPGQPDYQQQGVFSPGHPSYQQQGVLLPEYPEYQQQSKDNQSKNYNGQASGFVGGQVVGVNPNKPYSPNPFLGQNQPAFANGPVNQQVHQDAPNDPVEQVPVQVVVGPSNNQQYNAVPKSSVFQHGVVQPQQVGVVPASQVTVQPRHHVAGHEGFVAKEHASDDHGVNAQILHQEIDVSPDGSFHNKWDSDNGINVQEEGTIKHVGDTDVAVQQGVVSYVDNEGNHFELKYVADENGFHVEGPHIPTPPPIPAAIARSLQFIREHPYVETTTAHDEKYEPGQQQPLVDN